VPLEREGLLQQGRLHEVQQERLEALLQGQELEQLLLVGLLF
jgi:hypothetical protein